MSSPSPQIPDFVLIYRGELHGKAWFETLHLRGAEQLFIAKGEKLEIFIDSRTVSTPRVVVKP
jgi:hypothetical protein